MNKVISKLVSKAVAIGEKFVSGVSQEEAQQALGEVTVTDGMPELLRRAAAECTVLLKNNNVLPYKENSTVSVFGRGQYEWFFTGYGSGGDVKKPYGINLIDGLKNCDKLNANSQLADIYAKWNNDNPIDHGFWGHWPRYFPDMTLTDDIVKSAAKNSDHALYIIGRSSGEDRENALEKGSFYLTDNERDSLDKITKHFGSVTVLLNIGSIIDMSWIKDYGDKIGAVLLVWQGGMESGNAIADILCGNVNPCGKLADTVAEKYDDYPSQCFGDRESNNYEEDIYVGYRWFETFGKNNVLFPFGFGLSYTNFEIKHCDVKKSKEFITVECSVKNIGACSGKEVVQVYVSKPQGTLGNPARELVGFAKTSLLAPKKSEKLKIKIPLKYFSSYDDCGKSGNPYCYVLEEGEYSLYIGSDVRSSEKIWSYFQKETVVTKALKQTAAPVEPFERFVNSESGLKKEPVHLAEYNLRQIIIDNLPQPIIMTGDRGYKLKDVKDGKITLEQFTAQLDLDELEAISRGDYKMDSSLGARGNAGALGGVTESLREKGVPPVITTDGPSGIRLLAYCSLIPIGSAFACSFDTDLVKSVYSLLGSEMKEKGSDILLAPGMNIHRNVLCGRNFEYFSEDPVLSGFMAAATVEGIQSNGVSACPKHFACNNQETNRVRTDSRLSERALREIYLKGFEICIEKSNPKCIMTSYNKINGVWGHYNYELCQRILRDEWNYTGMVMTDWWMRYSASPEFPNVKDNGYRVRSAVDVLMPGGKRTGKSKPDGTLLATFGKTDGITSGEMQKVAMHVLNLCLNYID